jgi:hypothetical protein
MSRRTRTLQFFATPGEVREKLKQFRVDGLHVFEVVGGELQAVVTADDESARNRLFIGEQVLVAADAFRQPARWGLVLLDPPAKESGELRMTVLSAVNTWSDDSQGFVDDRALRIFDRLKKSIAGEFVGSVDVASRSTGVSRHYPAIRTTAGAVDLWRSGVRFVQAGVDGLDYLPHGEAIE